MCKVKKVKELTLKAREVSQSSQAPLCYHGLTVDWRDIPVLEPGKAQQSTNVLIEQKVYLQFSQFFIT